jgi:hypothetical protein
LDKKGSVASVVDAGELGRVYAVCHGGLRKKKMCSDLDNVGFLFRAQMFQSRMVFAVCGNIRWRVEWLSSAPAVGSPSVSKPVCFSSTIRISLAAMISQAR